MYRQTGVTRPYFPSIVKCLQGVDQQGSYATGGVCSMPLPSITLNDAPRAILGLPLADCQVWFMTLLNWY